MATLAESFLEDLNDLSDDEDVREELEEVEVIGGADVAVARSAGSADRRRPTPRSAGLFRRWTRGRALGSRCAFPTRSFRTWPSWRLPSATSASFPKCARSLRGPRGTFPGESVICLRLPCGSATATSLPICCDGRAPQLRTPQGMAG